MGRKRRIRCVECLRLFERMLREVHCTSCRSRLSDQDYLDDGAGLQVDEKKDRGGKNPYPVAYDNQ